MGAISGGGCEAKQMRMGLFKMADFMTFVYADGIVPSREEKNG